MVAPSRAIPTAASRPIPTNGAFVDELGEVPIDIAYGGSLHRGQGSTTSIFYPQVVQEARRRRPAGRATGVRLLHPVRLAGRRGVRARRTATLEIFERAGVDRHPARLRRLHRLRPRRLRRPPTQVTVSAINRNYKGRSGPGKLYLASPLTVAASAFTGSITAYRPGMFQAMKDREPALSPA